MIFPISFFGNGAKVRLLNSLFAYYKFDSGALTTDSYVSNTLSSTGSPTSTTGLINGALNLGVSNSSNVSLPNNSAIDLSHSMTINGWYYFNTTVDFFQNLIVANNNFNMYIHSSLGPFFQVNDNNTALIQLAYGSIPTANTWTMITLYYDAVKNVIGIYMNANTSTPATYPMQTYPASKGGSSGALTWQVVGSHNVYFDEFGIWQRVLTQKEITALYNGGAGLPFSSFTS